MDVHANEAPGGVAIMQLLSACRCIPFIVKGIKRESDLLKGLRYHDGGKLSPTTPSINECVNVHMNGGFWESYINNNLFMGANFSLPEKSFTRATRICLQTLNFPSKGFNAQFQTINQV